MENKIEYFLYCLEKLGIANMKQNFKGNHQESFAEIDRQEQIEINKCVKAMGR